MESNEDKVLIVVEDNGIGIATEMLDDIFDMFVQARVRGDGRSGLGLGLALSHQLVRLHEGTLVARSEGIGRGSRFEIGLPVVTAAEINRGESHSSEKPDGPLRIALVDDNRDARDLLAALLEAEGHVVRSAEDGTQGLALIRAMRPDAAIIDIGLPAMDGLAVARALREDIGHQTHLIALTGYGQASDVAKSRVAGFDVHLVKPASLKTVLDAISQRRR